MGLLLRFAGQNLQKRSQGVALLTDPDKSTYVSLWLARLMRVGGGTGQPGGTSG